MFSSALREATHLNVCGRCGVVSRDVLTGVVDADQPHLTLKLKHESSRRPEQE